MRFQQGGGYFGKTRFHASTALLIGSLANMYTPVTPRSLWIPYGTKLKTLCSIRLLAQTARVHGVLAINSKFLPLFLLQLNEYCTTLTIISSSPSHIQYNQIVTNDLSIHTQRAQVYNPQVNQNDTVVRIVRSYESDNHRRSEIKKIH